MYHVLVCDDETDIVSALDIYLQNGGYKVAKAFCGEEAVDIVRREDIQLVLLDIMMPGMDGMETLRRIREISNVPVIFLTAKGEETDMLMGLSAGADDYIRKPFNPIEVLARVRSHLRRYMQLGGGLSQDTLSVGGIELNDKTKTVLLDGEAVRLTKREYEILRFFMKHPGEVFSPRQIYENIWAETADGSENIVAVHIRHLREKLEYNPAEPRYIKAVWGHGYKIEDQL